MRQFCGEGPDEKHGHACDVWHVLLAGIYSFSIFSYTCSRFTTQDAGGLTLLASLSVLDDGHGYDILDLIDFFLTWLGFLWTSGAAIRARDTIPS